MYYGLVEDSTENIKALEALRQETTNNNTKCVKNFHNPLSKHSEEGFWKIDPEKRPQDFEKPIKALLAKAAKSDREKFVLDSGATKTMVNNLEYFQQINMRKDSIKLVYGSIVHSLGRGTIVLDLPNVALKSKESLYIPDLAANLISMSTF
ncbi:hypothetical protein O181_049980 [Austropuccinia psidii MF-1]|uniref:Retrovirus-related Pol polyprotein from transposon TNT 1-94-like beta-barrel domain-containing protein n=1 Tax=Austropuccinia psidii MF-1 TaxID=1389203 RepID=A0A9Q3HQJ3_9BASI|nr:hypothetical protein [Austropuccinia psidii MF-1]